MEIRRAVSADLPVVLEMMERFNQHEGIPWSSAHGAAAVRRLIADDTLGVIGIVLESDAARGYFVLTWGYDLEWNGRDAFLTELFFLPEARRIGLGKRALPEIEKLARAQGAHALHLMVRPENEPALNLYRGAGFATSPRHFMTKFLDPIE